MSLVKLPSDTARETLMRLYRERHDLREVFPEAETGDHRRLIDWAAGAASGSFVDSSYPVLRPYARWYRLLRAGVVVQEKLHGWSRITVPWANVNAATGLSANPLPLTLQTQQGDAANDISHHLVTLALLVIEFGLKDIVELGTRSGHSTLTLLEAARQTGGRVLSIDLDECRATQQKVAAAELGDWWRFIQQGDLEVPDEQLPPHIDLLFIDTNHLYDHTMAELRKYATKVRAGGWIAFHDYVSFPGVTRAVSEFLASLAQRARFYPYVHQNGLALVRIGEPTR